MSMDKRGVSQIITTILIVLLVLAAIVIVWQALKGTVEQSAEKVEKQAQCIGLDLTIGNAVCADGTNTVSVPVSRGGDSVDGDALTVTVTDANGVSRRGIATTLDALGTVVVSTFTDLADVGASVNINTGVTLSDGATICAGPTKTIICA